MSTTSKFLLSSKMTAVNAAIEQSSSLAFKMSLAFQSSAAITTTTRLNTNTLLSHVSTCHYHSSSRNSNSKLTKPNKSSPSSQPTSSYSNKASNKSIIKPSSHKTTTQQAQPSTSVPTSSRHFHSSPSSSAANPFTARSTRAAMARDGAIKKWPQDLYTLTVTCRKNNTHIACHNSKSVCKTQQSIGHGLPEAQQSETNKNTFNNHTIMAEQFAAKLRLFGVTHLNLVFRGYNPNSKGILRGLNKYRFTFVNIVDQTPIPFGSNRRRKQKRGHV